MNDTPTPRTDALANRLIPIAEDITSSNAQVIITHLFTGILTLTTVLEVELTAVTEQRDRLAEALIKCREDSICEQVRMEKCRYTKAADESQANIDRADKALQYLNQPNNA